MLTEPGKLTYGLDVDGVLHTDFELRLPTMEDMDCALEEVSPGASTSRIRRHVWARCITRLGTLAAVTPEMLAELSADEYGHFDAAEERLKKKLLAGSASAATSG